MDFQLISHKIEQNPHLIFPACVALFVLFKLLIFALKLAFMPCGVSVICGYLCSNAQLTMFCVVGKISWKKGFRIRQKGHNCQLGR